MSKTRKPVDARVEVSSFSRPNTTYDVTFYKDGEHWCSCPHFKNRPAVRAKGCKHVLAAKELRQQRIMHPIITERNDIMVKGYRFITRWKALEVEGEAKDVKPTNREKRKKRFGNLEV